MNRSFPESPVAMLKLDESRDVSPSNHPIVSETLAEEPTTPRETGNEEIGEDDEDRRRREEDESIALARALMAEEAMAVSYHMSVDYLRNNRDQFSEEDLAALQAAMDDDEGEAEVEEEQDAGLSYEMMLRLGERLGDVKSERWSRIAREKINELPTFKFDPEDVKGKDENDCEVKCLVCQFAYEKEETLRRLRCGHCFHQECADQWLGMKDFCPYCRNPIVDDGDNNNN